ncbi:MAG: hypothetical protein QOJ26_250 [Thermoplasmata archaeon]|jgi:hypothetical protein|nr:hypothetical protein [Thermoplasmata archaeon]
MMPDPASTLRDLEQLVDVPCAEWSGDLAGRGMELDCEGVAAGQAALRQALAEGGTHHDVLGRLRRQVESARLSAKRRLIALAVVDIARSTARQRLALALGHLGSPGVAVGS